MITISVCMIVKDEESVLARCLDSLKEIADEIIIVDTGSTDKTKKIATGYTDKIYDYKWENDFAAARNFSFSKATGQYIYQADADEVIDEENRRKFMQLKEILLPEIDIVQMLYSGQLNQGTVYNFDEEYRPKLFKRLREFVWMDRVHESVRLMPVVYDSEIRVLHLPERNHSERDFSIFEKMGENGERLSKKLHHMYAQELFISGEDKDFLPAERVFRYTFSDDSRDMDEKAEAACVLARCARIKDDIPMFFKYALKNIASGGCAEMCYELGMYYYQNNDLDEAEAWFTTAVSGIESILALKYAEKLAPEMLEKIKAQRL